MGVQLEVDVVDLAQQRRELVAARGDPAHVDGQAQRVIREHARPRAEPLIEHVEALDRADLLARAPQHLHRVPQQLAPVDGGLAARRVE